MTGRNGHGEMRNECTILVGKPEGKRPLAEPIHRLRVILLS
jgi:hypothetical protein